MIEVNGLFFEYPGAKQPAVNDLEFSIEDGEIFGFLGPNGAGKSTTQKVLTGLLRDYGGKVHVLGRAQKVCLSPKRTFRPRFSMSAFGQERTFDISA